MKVRPGAVHNLRIYLKPCLVEVIIILAEDSPMAGHRWFALVWYDAGRVLDITQILAELRSELELIDVAIRALERFAYSIGIEEDDPTAQNSSRCDRESRRPGSRER